MAIEYPDNGYIYVCLRVRSVPTLSELELSCSSRKCGAGRMSPRHRPPRSTTRASQRICVSTLENIVALHDPKSLDDAACAVRDAQHVVQLLVGRSLRTVGKHSKRRPLMSTATANYFEFDNCLASMDADSMLQMPIVRNSDFIRPPEYGSQEDVYLSTAVHAVSAAVEGINSCVFAYGQTGSGKTYTLFGDAAYIQRDPGVVPRTMDDLFMRLEAIKRNYEENTETDYSFRVQLSFFEIYQNEAFCLFSRKGPLRVTFVRDSSGREALVIHELQRHFVTAADKAMPLVELGFGRRQTGETGMNAHSSRSHTILQLHVTQWRTDKVTRETVELNALLNIVDLAGSERQKTAKTDGKSRDEGIEINQSLTTLSRVINEISQGSKYVNYRDSLLTMVLRDYLGGNSKTFMIATISPVAFCYQESCATMQYAKGVRKIRNRPVVNTTFQTRNSLLELNAALKQENEKLRQHVENLLKVAGSGHSIDGLLSESDARDSDSGEITICGTIPHKTLRCGAPIKRYGTVSEAVFSTADHCAVPLVVTVHRKYKNSTGIGVANVEGSRIGISSLTRNVVQFHLSDLLSGAEGSGQLVARPKIPQLKCLETSHGLVEFERMPSNSCERRYWVRYVPPCKEGDEAVLHKKVVCHMNGIKHSDGDQWSLTHGDVFCVYIDSVGDDSEKSFVTFHYVDANCLARHGRYMESNDMPEDIASQLAPVSAPGSAEEQLSQLKHNRTNLLEVLRWQAQSVDYQCQLMGVPLLRQGSETVKEKSDGGSDRHSCYTPNSRGFDAHYDNETSPLPRPMLPYGDHIHTHMHSVKPMDMSTAAHAFQRTSNWKCCSVGAGALAESQRDCLRESEVCSWRFAKRSVEFGEVARCLAELERSSSLSQPVTANVVNSPPMESGIMEDGKGIKFIGCGDEAVVRVEKGTDTIVHMPYQKGGDEFDGGERKVKGLRESKTSTPSGAANPLRNGPHPREGARTSPLPGTRMSLVGDFCSELNADTVVGYSANANIFHLTSDGVRERELWVRIRSLERSVEDLRGQKSVLESKLRIAQDANTELELSEAQLKDELSQLTKEFLDSAADHSKLKGEISNLGAILHSMEGALMEVSVVSEFEMNEQFPIMAEKILMLRALTRMWKRRAMGSVARGTFTSGSRSSTNVSLTSGEGRTRGVVQASRDDLHLELSDTRAQQFLKEHVPDFPANTSVVEHSEKETAAESVFVVGTVLVGLEREKNQLVTDVNRERDEGEHYKGLVFRVQGDVNDLKMNAKKRESPTTEKMAERMAVSSVRSRQLVEAGRKRDASDMNLWTTDQADSNIRKKSLDNKVTLLQEQRMLLKQQQREYDRRAASLACKVEELRYTLSCLREKVQDNGPNGFKDANDLYQRVEELINEAMSGFGGQGCHSTSPPDFKFTGEMITLVLMGLRILLDRLKVELYVLNRQSLHRFALIAPAVHLRPETQFRYYMHKLRGTISGIARKPQCVGADWTVTEADILSGLVSHRRRQAGDALYGLLIWYDHWDVAAKTDHICYVELIRNRDHVMQIARLVRQESLVNTNATSCQNLLPDERRASTLGKEIPRSGKNIGATDITVTASRNILGKLSARVKNSTLGNAMTKWKKCPPGSTSFRGTSASSTLHSPSQESGLTFLSLAPNTTFTPLDFPSREPMRLSKSGHLQKQSQSNSASEKPSGSTVEKFGRRSRIIVVPVSEADITVAASTGLPRRSRTFNYARNLSTAYFSERELQPRALTKACTRFSRSKTFAALGNMAHGKPCHLSNMASKSSSVCEGRNGKSMSSCSFLPV
ncbi:kinesin, putative [Trypanosoma brucei brucei TREU927]|uniref:Kinesin, putative n=1 Tax=Trypanosoma brucei brucei (strain 927/4 GUTat10.1) TaxID=185431 RepID=Q38CC9_TRYB2|nr:kinesin, putative [Trypanosoma brucei brucei TREU927]EAN77541.1 kinesin, putative [Trypanosoma brucei brucei TREU927]